MSKLKKSRILIVDDVAENIKILITLFQKDYDIFFSKKGESALQIAIANKPDLIVLDIVMPDMDGYEVCKQLKSNRKTREIPVIFVSALEETIDKVKGFKAGCVDYITRPFQVDEIKVRVKNHITLFKLQHELEQQITSRTEELISTNKQLQAEIRERKKIENELNQKQVVLEEANTTLKTILEKKDEAREELEERILLNVKQTVMPYLEKIKKEELSGRQKDYLEVLESNLNNLVSPLIKTLDSKYLSLTSSELKIADLIKNGRSSKSIAGLLGLSPNTIEFHRKNIRKKLGLTDKSINLRTFLRTF